MNTGSVRCCGSPSPRLRVLAAEDHDGKVGGRDRDAVGGLGQPLLQLLESEAVSSICWRIWVQWRSMSAFLPPPSMLVVFSFSQRTFFAQPFCAVAGAVHNSSCRPWWSTAARSLAAQSTSVQSKTRYPYSAAIKGLHKGWPAPVTIRYHSQPCGQLLVRPYIKSSPPPSDDSRQTLVRVAKHVVCRDREQPQAIMMNYRHEYV